MRLVAIKIGRERKLSEEGTYIFNVYGITQEEMLSCGGLYSEPKPEWIFLDKFDEISITGKFMYSSDNDFDYFTISDYYTNYWEVNKYDEFGRLTLRYNYPVNFDTQILDTHFS